MKLRELLQKIRKMRFEEILSFGQKGDQVGKRQPAESKYEPGLSAVTFPNGMLPKSSEYYLKIDTA